MIRWSFVAFGMLLAFPASAGPVENGEHIYRAGLRSDGTPVTARVMGDATLSGRFAACVRCHRPSGYGVSEGDIRSPAITAGVLFSPLEPRRDLLLRELYQERLGPTARLQAKTPRTRPAYRGTSDLARALNAGIDPGGRSLSPSMPRYDLDADDVNALHAYLKSIGTGLDLGVDEHEINFATIFGPQIPPEQQAGMTAVMRAFVATNNREIRREQSWATYSPNYKSLYVPSRRLWRLHEWRLTGPSETWAAQLATYAQRQPVFAALGGAAQDWAPIHRFCEDAQLPCLFPLTEWPVSEPGHFTLYLSRGLEQEAQMIADDLARSGKERVMQIRENTANSQRLAEVFGNLARARGIAVDTIDLASAGGRMPQAKALVLWLGPDSALQVLRRADLKAFPGPVFAAGGLLADRQGRLTLRPPRPLLVAWRFSRPGAQPQRIFRLRSWLNARRVTARIWVRAQLNTYLSLDITRHALEHLVDRYSRELFIETVEHQAESSFNPGTFERLSMGPGQRFAAKGHHIMLLDTGGVLR